MISEVHEGVVKYGKQDVRVENFGAAGLRIHFADGSLEDADLVVEAGGRLERAMDQDRSRIRGGKVVPRGGGTTDGRVPQNFGQ